MLGTASFECSAVLATTLFFVPRRMCFYLISRSVLLNSTFFLHFCLIFSYERDTKWITFDILFVVQQWRIWKKELRSSIQQSCNRLFTLPVSISFGDAATKYANFATLFSNSIVYRNWFPAKRKPNRKAAEKTRIHREIKFIMSCRSEWLISSAATYPNANSHNRNSIKPEKKKCFREFIYSPDKTDTWNASNPKVNRILNKIAMGALSSFLSLINFHNDGPGSFVFPHTACLSTVPLLLATNTKSLNFYWFRQLYYKIFFFAMRKYTSTIEWTSFFHQQNKNSENLRLRLSFSTQTGTI